ncbi:WecB/TagA/CpsF family glycosyltransferase [Arenivirga flava]|uniref:WecB/TagA/CpsF family glycosyl transferase n=1 Tax=Arenivirga flava TaxID=1930060 RepID=A0AA37XB86_9MICO|nr:WecB/TagA/CpsF family glycosyltransferase [Arenivirga flava]GMA28065.1 WecB/TagA/CpsF family glycosyl transferase [Arenivirga flava]
MISDQRQRTGLSGQVLACFKIGHLHVDALDAATAARELDALMDDKSQPHIVVTPNIVQIEQARRYPILAEVNQLASLRTPDGWPVAAAARSFAPGLVRSSRVTGADLVAGLVESGRRIALVGGVADSAAIVAAKYSKGNSNESTFLSEPAPAAELQSPGARSKILSRICEFEPEAVILGIGVPKQEQVAIELHRMLSTGVIICAGASIEFLAGTQKRAPKMLQRLGLEWLHRIVMRPGTMVSRYLKAGPYFVAQMALSTLRHTRARFTRSAQ